MNEQLAKLYELQLADSGIAQRQQEIAHLDDGSRARDELAAAEAELARSEEKLRRDHANLRDLELRLASTEEEYQDKYNRCYGGLESDPKKLAALERKIAELADLKGRLEEQILVLMDQVEEEEQQVEALRGRVGGLRAQLQQIEEQYRSQRARLEEEIATLEQQRARLLEEIDRGLLESYRRLRERLGGVAVAGVIDYTCSACHTAVPRDVAERIPSSSVPVYCENCHRILWVVPEA
jgi:predicted  nucleic acid-binding Zn-ribbon protein